jgi:hypothetical protein
MLLSALTAPFERRTWAEFGYAVLGLPLGVIGFALTVTTLAASAGLLVTLIGLPVLAGASVATRWLGGGMRRLANKIGAGVPSPPPLRAGTGRFGRIGAAAADPVAWRARCYLVLKLPLGIATFVTAAVFWLYGLAAVTYWFWRPFLPCNDPASPVCHRGAQFGEHYPLDTPGRIAATAGVGVVLLICAPWAVRGVVALDRSAARALLGPRSLPPAQPRPAQFAMDGAR